MSSELIESSKSVPSPRRFIVIISRFNSKTEIPVPSKVTRDGSFWDLNRKNTEEDIMIERFVTIIGQRCLISNVTAIVRLALILMALEGSQAAKVKEIGMRVSVKTLISPLANVGLSGQFV